jgi:hypothetical protein
MRPLAVLLALTALSCGRVEVPTNAMLWRIDRPWVAGERQGFRTSQATVVVFLSGNEYVELHSALIEQPDSTVYLRAGRPRVVAIGRWEVRDGKVVATRERVSAGGSLLCEPRELTFAISGQSVSGNAGGSGAGLYSPVTRLVAPDFKSYVDAARKSAIACGPGQPSSRN